MKTKQLSQAQSGRSMVEILGVMAIIGVLSIGGIQGYRYAMEKHRANDIVNEVNLRARDTWNMYQTKDLPDAEEIEGWSNMTQTGFPIGVYPRSNILFDVEVENVPNGVCKKVLDMDIQGPLFIWIPDGENRRIYNGDNPEICGEDGDEAVSMVFTTTLETFGDEEGIRDNPLGPDNRPLRYCLSDDDCQSKCERCGADYTCQSDCPAGTPICSTNEYKVCVVCESNEDCPENQICDESSGENQCVEIPEKCADGYFRSKNGACIECSYGGNVIVSEDAFSAIGIQDEQTGVEMCNACETAGKKRMLENITNEDGSKTYYCSKTCTRGISVQTTDHGCVSCGDFPPYVDYEIVTDAQVQEQCKACGLKLVNRYCGYFNCQHGQFKSSDGVCRNCTNGNGYSIYNATEFQTMCVDNCDGKRFLFNDTTCALVCPQPTDISEEESIRICQEEGPTSSNCKRTMRSGHWQESRKCYSCSRSDSISLSGLSASEKELCNKCGRIEKNGFCIIPQTCIVEQDENGINKSTNQFMNREGECIKCTSTAEENSRIDQTEDAKNACINNCAGVKGNVNGVTFTGRHVVSTNKGFNYCFPKCPEGYFQNSLGSCIPCNSNTSNNSDTYIRASEWGMVELKGICEATTCNREVMHDLYCAAKTCPQGYFKTAYGNCVSCSQADVSVKIIQNWNEPATGFFTEDEKIKVKNMCSACGNRVVVAQNEREAYCVVKNLGVSGICNNVGNGELSGYSEGQGRLFRDRLGMCHDCSLDQTVTVGYGTGYEQCKSCGNRRIYPSYDCVLGLCEQGSTFMKNDGTCVACNVKVTEIDNTITSIDGCEACNRNVMSIRFSDEEEKYYCIIPCGKGITYLTHGDVSCKSCSSGGISVIGQESIFSEHCEACNRVAFVEDGIKKCSNQAVEGSSFIDVQGQKVSCTSTSSVEIYNSNKAIELCEMCTSKIREVVYEDGKVYCEVA